jgi:hypothetical protein
MITRFIAIGSFLCIITSAIYAAEVPYVSYGQIISESWDSNLTALQFRNDKRQQAIFSHLHSLNKNHPATNDYVQALATQVEALRLSDMLDNPYRQLEIELDQKLEQFNKQIDFIATSIQSVVVTRDKWASHYQSVLDELSSLTKYATDEMNLSIALARQSKELCQKFKGRILLVKSADIERAFWAEKDSVSAYIAYLKKLNNGHRRAGLYLMSAAYLGILYSHEAMYLESPELAGIGKGSSAKDKLLSYKGNKRIAAHVGFYLEGL